MENGSSSSSSVSAMSPPPLNLTKIKRNPEKQSQPEPMKKRKFDFANLARSATEPDDDIDVIHSTSNQGFLWLKYRGRAHRLLISISV